MEQPTKACKRCGIEKTFDEFPREPRIKDGVANRCRECDRERRREWRERNTEHAATYQREYRQRNIERVREVARRWRAANREVDAATRNRRNAITSALTEHDRMYAGVLRQDPCAYCGGPSGVDHIVPVVAGGELGWCNMTGCCPLCNSRKHALPMWLFLLRRTTDKGARE